ncbi:hypothetical protein AB6A40_007332 [Gnathostoma spinigerum]|uniref:Uncharacterized protein n=1 Tax=Gnathostoma spinigerum TaxID=75299 RepID=A0ABD6EUA3_9BILA
MSIEELVFPDGATSGCCSPICLPHGIGHESKKNGIPVVLESTNSSFYRPTEEASRKLGLRHERASILFNEELFKRNVRKAHKMECKHKQTTAQKRHFKNRRRLRLGK